MDIIDRFSTHLKDALTRSIRLASELKNPSVEPIHLFFALSNQRGSVAAEILNRFKLEAKILEQAVLVLPIISEIKFAPAGPVAEAVITPLSPSSKSALEKAMLLASEHDHNFVGTEHLLSAILRLNDPIILNTLKAAGVKLGELENQLHAVLHNATNFPQINDVAEVVERLQDNLNNFRPPAPTAKNAATVKEQKKPRKKDTALDFFATNLTGAEAQKNIDPVIGREAEIERVIQILCRRAKNNPLLLGEPGVGKTAIVEGLAKRISEGKVPDLLLNKKIYSLDMGMLIAGTIYRGEFEGRLREVIDDVVDDPNIILFIDEVHNIVGAGSGSGAMDAANILKPALARGLLRCIGATTPSEYKKYIESDAALERRFQPVFAKEPGIADTIKILEGIKNNYEAYHAVTILPEAVEATVKLADRYIVGKFMPDKAIDLLDECAAAKRLSAKSSALSGKLWRLEQQLEKTILAKEDAAREDKFNAAVEFKKAEESLRFEINHLTEERKNKPAKIAGIVTAKDVANQVAKIIGTAPSELIMEDSSELNSLEEKLGKFVIGQSEVIKEVSARVRQAQLGLGSPERPLASFLFVGESGVGKTELAKTLAKVLYQDSGALIKLDMSEFNESFSVSKLLGSPAGYVGYKESNQFSDKIKLHPYCVLLLDEIDKAHKDVVRLLLQMLENGEITDASGKKVSLRHAIIILTTSLGAEKAGQGGFGFGAQGGPASGGGDPFRKQIIKGLIEKLKEHFSPEVINRLDQICFFNKLGAAELAKIAALEVERLNEQLAQYQTKLFSDDEALGWAIGQLPKEQAGARELRRSLRGKLEELLSDIILKNKIKPRYRLTVSKDKLLIK